jgi:hypothetical protein
MAGGRLGWQSGLGHCITRLLALSLLGGLKVALVLACQSTYLHPVCIVESVHRPLHNVEKV